MKNAAGIFTPIVINYILKNYIIIILVHQTTFKVRLNIKYHTVNFGPLPPLPHPLSPKAQSSAFMRISSG